jgi:hypothetical protein
MNTDKKTKKLKTRKTSKSVKTSKSDKSGKIDSSSSVNTDVDQSSSVNVNTQMTGTEIILNDDTMDMMEGMVDKLEETNNMAEKVRLHSEISTMTGSIKFIIDGLIKDVDDHKIMADSSSIFADDLDPNGQFDVLDKINNLETELENMDEIDDLQKKALIYTQLQRKCHVLKKAADNGDLVIRKCN